VEVNLYRSNGTLWPPTTTTSALGAYSFTLLPPGDYYLVFGAKTGYNLSPVNQGSDDKIDSDANPVTRRTSTLTLAVGQNDVTWDAGMNQRTSLGDFVWKDVNGDGIQDGGTEIGIDGATVHR
jgi:hypothetical protein